MMDESRMDWRAVLARVFRYLSNGVLAVYVVYWWGAVFYDGPLGQANLWNALLACLWLAGVVVLWRRLALRWQRVLSVFGMSLLVIIPWSFIQPSNDKEWAEDFAETGTVSVDGDVITFHNFRDFDYTRDGEVTPRWVTRKVHYSKLQGLDIFHDRFLGNLMAHPILSFDFGDDGHICLSIETRREKGETFSPFGGLYKMFELQYIFASEEDAVRVRTNIREEPVYLYRSAIPLEEVQQLFLSSIDVQNHLAEHPQFYNVVNANCTTSIRNQIPEDRRSPFDIRMLVNGLLDQYLYQKEAIVSEGLSFEELRERCLIDEVARAAHDDPQFSQRIREGRPGQNRGAD
ncbi:DUF4105 domain-containing protein [Rubritalea tangerina]|uniref:DUF4105 domain-containing protein n=1 Tax=Rubritalea tangerina TaxID=430798 RepID=A0ABW4ZAY2_9BACT